MALMTRLLLPAFLGPALKRSVKKAVVPDTVRIGKKTYKVTAVAGNAFTGYDNLRQVKTGNIAMPPKSMYNLPTKIRSSIINERIGYGTGQSIDGLTWEGSHGRARGTPPIYCAHLIWRFLLWQFIFRNLKWTDIVV